MSRSKKYIVNGRLLIIFAGFFFGMDVACGQAIDSSRVINSSESSLDSLNTDTTKIIEDAALDIAQDRGLFIVTPDRLMQLRILGSVRYLLVFDDRDLPKKNSLSTYQIQVGDQDKYLPIYYNGLSQSRLGFEVTRKKQGGNVFVRLETDFAGVNGFRIRHAYGQYRGFLLGQTWSLFSHIKSLPATVGTGGPAGSISVRTPQIRYTFHGIRSTALVSVGLEYFKPDLFIPDTLAVKSFQALPDITARIERSTNWGMTQLSGVLPFLSGTNPEGNLVIKTGWGISFSTVIESWAGGKWYFQASGGQAVSRFFDDLSGQGLDLLINPQTGKSYLPYTFGTFLTYEHHWTPKLFSNFSYALQMVYLEDPVPDDSYHRGNNLRFNTFWSIVEGSRLGFEYIHAFRKNKDGAIGRVNRVNLLFYYDF
jgi:hypothetical protein